MSEGILDTNVFIHAHTSDAHATECQKFLSAVEKGSVQAELTPLVLHEISYALPRYIKQMRREQVAEYLLTVINWAGVRGDKEVLVDTVELWRDSPGLDFVDSYLIARTSEKRSPIFTKNGREIERHGGVVPNPLPS